MLTEKRIIRKRIVSENNTEKKLARLIVASWIVAFAIAALLVALTQGILVDLVLAVYYGYVILTAVILSILAIRMVFKKRKIFEVRCFNSIDSLIGKKQTLAGKIRTIKRIYLPGGQVDKMVKRNGIDILVKRKAFLESEIYTKEKSVTLPSDMLLSSLMAISTANITYTLSDRNDILKIAIMLIPFFILILLAVAYNMSAKSDEEIVIMEIELMKVDEKLSKFMRVSRDEFTENIISVHTYLSIQNHRKKGENEK